MSFPWGVSFCTGHCLRDSHQLLSLAMLNQGGFRWEYRVLRFLSRAVFLGCLAVKHIELNAHMQEFARSDLWGLTFFRTGEMQALIILGTCGSSQ